MTYVKKSRLCSCMLMDAQNSQTVLNWHFITSKFSQFGTKLAMQLIKRCFFKPWAISFFLSPELRKPDTYLLAHTCKPLDAPSVLLPEIVIPSADTFSITLQSYSSRRSFCLRVSGAVAPSALQCSSPIVSLKLSIPFCFLQELKL